MNKNKRITYAFIGTLIIVLLLNLFKPDFDLSKGERRKLKQFPELTHASLSSGDFFEDFEAYAMDQMIYRDPLRNFKALISFSVFQKYDNNDVFIKNGHAFKMTYPFDATEVENMAKKMERIYELYLTGMDVYYGIIPDKNYYIRSDDPHLFLDYEAMTDILNANLTHFEAIDLFDCLTLQDYYQSDLHWRQEQLGPVINKIGESMGFETRYEASLYEKVENAPFYGAYYGQANALVEADHLIYLTNEWLENARVTHYEADEKITDKKVYDVDKFNGLDGYDLFLSGPSPIVEIENPENLSGKSLLFFRDSFGSSIAPLLLAEYSKITLIDLRYITMDQLGDFIDFEDQEVLFLYNTLILNNSGLIR